MTTINTMNIEALANAARNSKFDVVEVETNKGLTIYLEVSKKLIQTTLEMDDPYHKQVSDLNNLAVTWVHKQSGNLCAAWVRKIMLRSDADLSNITDVATGVSWGMGLTTQVEAELKLDLEVLKGKLEAKRRLEQMAVFEAAPETAEFIRQMGLKVEDF